MTQDDNYINMLVNPQSYVWNFSNTQVTSYFGRDDHKYGNKISDLKSTAEDATFKAFGSVTKWIASGTIVKGTCVRLTNTQISGVDYINIETYSVTDSNVLEQSQGAALLGIALNDAVDGGECYVCTKGITTVVIGNISQPKIGSYGVLSNVGGTTGRVIALDSNTGILGNTPVVGYFLETKTTNVAVGDYILFNVQTNFEFN